MFLVIMCNLNTTYLTTSHYKYKASAPRGIELRVSMLDDVQDVRAKVLVMDTIFGFVAKANIGVSKAINKGPGVDAGLQVEM